MKPALITGGAGFIGSNLVEFLNGKGIVPYVLENWSNLGEKWRNLCGLRYIRVSGVDQVPRDVIIIHLGANVDTRERMSSSLW